VSQTLIKCLAILRDHHRRTAFCEHHDKPKDPPECVSNGAGASPAHQPLHRGVPRLAARGPTRLHERRVSHLGPEGRSGVFYNIRIPRPHGRAPAPQAAEFGPEVFVQNDGCAVAVHYGTGGTIDAAVVSIASV
jgi:hypothetical protein